MIRKSAVIGQLKLPNINSVVCVYGQGNGVASRYGMNCSGSHVNYIRLVMSKTLVVHSGLLQKA